MRTKEQIIKEIEDSTKWAKTFINLYEKFTESAEKNNKLAKCETERIEKLKQELKEQGDE